MTDLKQKAENVRRLKDSQRTDARVRGLDMLAKRLELAAANGNWGGASLDDVERYCHLFDALACAMPTQQRLSRRVALHRTLLAIGRAKLAHWRATQRPNPLTLHRWLRLFAAFAPELRDDPDFKRAMAVPAVIRF